jgi:hypothetical protein
MCVFETLSGWEDEGRIEVLGHVLRLEKMRILYKILIRNPEKEIQVYVGD